MIVGTHALATAPPNADFPVGVSASVLPPMQQGC